MILNETFFECLDQANKLLTRVDEFTARAATFLPLRNGVEYKEEYKKNPYEWYRSHPYESPVINVNPTEGYKQDMTGVWSPYCCGFGEISGALYPYVGPNQIKLGEAFGITDKHRLELIGLAENLAHSARSFVVYNAPEDYSSIQTLLKELGFTEILRFANAIHNNRAVIMLGCHMMPVVRTKGFKLPKWLDTSITKVVQNAAAATTSESTTTEVSSASDATGGRVRKVRRALGI